MWLPALGAALFVAVGLWLGRHPVGPASRRSRLRAPRPASAPRPPRRPAPPARAAPLRRLRRRPRRPPARSGALAGAARARVPAEAPGDRRQAAGAQPVAQATRAVTAASAARLAVDRVSAMEIAAGRRRRRVRVLRAPWPRGSSRRTRGFRSPSRTSDKLAGESVACAPRPSGADARAARFVANGDGARARRRRATPCCSRTAADVSMRLAPAFAERGKQVVDLSGAFRLEAGALPALVRLRARRPRVARPGPLRPARSSSARPPRGAHRRQPRLLPHARRCSRSRRSCARGWSSRGGIIVDAKSGVTGAGRQSGEAYSFVEYRRRRARLQASSSHQHTPEIARALSRFAPGVDAHLHGAPAARRARPPRHLLRAPAARGDRRARRRSACADAYAHAAVRAGRARPTR